MKQPSYLSLASLNRLRAAVLGANDGIISTASLLMGVAGSGANSRALFIAGIAALVAGAFSMAIGEYVSVASQKDAEKAHKPHEKGEYSSPSQAAIASFVAFSFGGAVPLVAITLSPESIRIGATVVAVVIALLFTGYSSATFGKASRPRAMARILIGGLLAMAVTYGIGSLIGTAV